MDNDLLFLENLSNLLEQGYGIEETLLICKALIQYCRKYMMERI